MFQHIAVQRTDDAHGCDFSVQKLSSLTHWLSLFLQSLRFLLQLFQLLETVVGFIDQGQLFAKGIQFLLCFLRCFR